MCLKRKREIALTLFAVAGLFCVHTLHAQTVDEVAAKYPNNYAVISNVERTLDISLRNGTPYAESRDVQDMLVLDDKANGKYNRDYFYNSSFSQLLSYEAHTSIPDGKKSKKLKVTDFKTESSRSSYVFYDDAEETSFDFPALVKGAVAHQESVSAHKDVHVITPFYCASYLPIMHAVYTVNVPADMVLKYSIRNDKNHKIQVSESNKGKTHTYVFTANDMDVPIRFQDAPSYAYYEPHVIVQLVSYKDGSGNAVPFLGTLDDLYHWYYSFITDVNTNQSDTLKRLADSLTHGVASDKEKARNIYQWVQGNIKYVAFEDGLGGFIPRQAATVCSRRFGDCKDMASILTSLLRYAGLKAYFTWIGTRDIPYDYTDVPLPISDNHMICALNLDNNWIFLDATDPNCIFGLPSSAIQGKQALISISKEQYKVERVPEVELTKNELLDSTYISLSSNGIKGFESVYYDGYWGTDIYNRLMFSDSKEIKDYVKYRMAKASNKFIMGDYGITKTNPVDKQVNIHADFEVPDYSKKIADELYINLNLEKFYFDNMIDTSRRKVPVENEYKYVIKQYTILQVPDNYEVSYLPADYSLNKGFMNISIRYKKEGNKIIALQELQHNCLMLTPDKFDEWNESLKQLNNQYKEQVVLKEKN